MKKTILFFHRLLKIELRYNGDDKMKVLTSEEAQKLNKFVIKHYGIPPVMFMDQAGRTILDVLLREYPKAQKFLIVCGKGNNGGDGLVLARRLKQVKREPFVVLLEDREKMSPLSRLNFDLVTKMSIKYVFADDILYFDELKHVDVVVDSMIGTGFTGILEGNYLKLANFINDLDKPVVSVDIPSGINPDNGKVEGGVAVKADCTVTIIAPKRGFFLLPASEYVGKLHVADLGLFGFDGFDQILPPSCRIADHSFLSDIMPTRPRGAWKGSVGKLLVIAGSTEYAGSAELLCKSAMRAGCGMVYLAVPKEILDVMKTKLVEEIIIPYSKDDLTKLYDTLNKVDALAVGSGIGQSQDIKDVLKKILLSTDKPIVFDADSLHSDLLSYVKSKEVVITPHVGEMSRLLSKTITSIKTSMIESAFEAIEKFKDVVCVLKCSNSIIALPDGTFYFNTTGSEAMATAGSGDVLTGIIGSLLSKGLSASNSAVLGCFLHGFAGDIAREKIGDFGVIASDIVNYIPKATDFLLKMKK